MSKRVLKRMALLADPELPESTRLMLKAIQKLEDTSAAIRGDLVRDLTALKSGPSPSDLPSPPEERCDACSARGTRRGRLDGEVLYDRKKKRTGRLL